MTNTTQTARERIGSALYMLGAGADPELFLRVLRTYVLQHVQTTAQAVELLRDLAKVNPPAFAEAVLKIVKTDGAKLERALTASQTRARAKQRKRTARTRA